MQWFWNVFGGMPFLGHFSLESEMPLRGVKEAEMETGCSILHISEVETAKAAGYDYIEMAGKSLVQMDGRDFWHVEKILYENNFLCKGINAYCPESLIMAGPGFDLKRAEEYARLCAGRAGAVGVKRVGIGSPRSRRLPEGYDRKKADLQLIDFLKKTAEVFGKQGIQICLEPLAPCYCNYINSMEEGMEIVDRINWSDIGLLGDFYNLEKAEEADEDMGRYMQRLLHVHISDDEGSPWRRSYLKEEKAQIHQRRLGRLYENGYAGAVSL